MSSLEPSNLSVIVEDRAIDLTITERRLWDVLDANDRRDSFVIFRDLTSDAARKLANAITAAVEELRHIRVTFSGRCTVIQAIAGRLTFLQDGRQRTVTHDFARDVAWQLQNAANVIDYKPSPV